MNNHALRVPLREALDWTAHSLSQAWIRWEVGTIQEARSAATNPAAMYWRFLMPLKESLQLDISTTYKDTINSLFWIKLYRDHSEIIFVSKHAPARMSTSYQHITNISLICFFLIVVSFGKPYHLVASLYNILLMILQLSTGTYGRWPSRVNFWQLIKDKSHT